MNEETMRKHYEATPKDRLINILISAREEFNKLQNRNKECKLEVERLNKIIGHALGYIECANKVDIIYVCKILKGDDKE